MQKVTSVSRKAIGVPKTSLEKFDKMNLKNPALQKLKEAFDLEIEL